MFSAVFRWRRNGVFTRCEPLAEILLSLAGHRKCLWKPRGFDEGWQSLQLPTKMAAFPARVARASDLLAARGLALIPPPRSSTHPEFRANAPVIAALDLLAGPLSRRARSALLLSQLLFCRRLTAQRLAQLLFCRVEPANPVAGLLFLRTQSAKRVARELFFRDMAAQLPAELLY